MRNPRSAYVRRKQARKACVHCGSHDVVAVITEMGTHFVCLAIYDLPWWHNLYEHTPYDDPYGPKHSGGW